MLQVQPHELPLQRLYHWEKARAGEVFLTQPLPGGAVRDYTWAEALGESRRIAAHLRAQGWPAGSRVAILAKNCAHWIMADFAIWIAGYVSVPVYPSLVAGSLRQILEHSEAKACFVGSVDDWNTTKSGVPLGVGCIALPGSSHEGAPRWDELVSKLAPLPGEPVVGGDELATIIYTSGTTGIPKGVMHTHRTLAHAALLAVRLGEGNADDRLLSYLPLAHTAERLLVESTAIQTGCRIFFNQSIETFITDLKRARPTTFLSVPRLWTKFQQGVFEKMPKQKLDRLFHIPLVGRMVKKKLLRELGLDSVRIAVSGAAPLPPEIHKWYRSLGLELFEGYAMTENFGISHSSRPGKVRIGSVGQTFEGVECKLSDTGEILVKSPCTMQGYFKDPEATRHMFTDDGFLRTGDVGELDKDGYLKITGRAKEQFKTSKGKYVAPAPIENKLGAHPKIEASCVAGLGFPQPFAIVMLAAGEWTRSSTDGARRALTDSLEAHLRSVNAELDPHERMDFLAVVPEQWSVDNDLITPTLKVKRQSIEKRYGAAFERWAAQDTRVVWHES